MDRFAIRRGSAYPGASALNENELGYWTTGKTLFIGTASGPQRVASAACADGQFPFIRLIGVYQSSQVANGTVFEGPDGGLYYKNRNGVTLPLTAVNEE